MTVMAFLVLGFDISLNHVYKALSSMLLSLLNAHALLTHIVKL